jgi:DNA-binding LacI/PurR family transcriptional regulator
MSLTNPFHAELVEDIHLAASERGYDVVVSPLTGVSDEWHTALRLVDQRCEAAVLLGPALTRRQLESITQHTPVVVVGRRVSARGVAVVRAADDKGVAAAVKHLTGLGHQRIAFVDGPPVRSPRCGDTAFAGHATADRIVGSRWSSPEATPR